jgi:L-threonylcarbamoyladenylate synthase
MLPLKSTLAFRSNWEAGIPFAYATEGVYGLGCNPSDQAAVEDLLDLKKRDWKKGLILVSGQIKHFSPWVDNLTAKQKALLHKSWPGPVTFLVPDPDLIAPPWIRGAHDKIALRLSAHPLIGALSDIVDSALVSTSANRAGVAAAIYPWQVMRQLPKVNCVIRAPLTQPRKPSRIIDLSTQEQYR